MPRRVARVAVAALMLALAATPTGPAAAATTVSVPASIDASGGADVTQDLVRFFATVPAGSTVQFPNHGRYRIEGVLRLTGLENVTIEGNGSELFAQTDGSGVPPVTGYKGHWPRLRQHVAVRNSNRLTVRNLSIRGPNNEGRYVAALEGQAGITVARSTNVVLDHVSVSRTFGDGVSLSGEARAVTVRDGSFDTIGRQGIAITAATDVTVEGNRFEKVAHSVFDIEATPRSTVQAVHIRGNEVGDFTNFLLAAGGAGPNVSDIWLEQNRVTGGNGIAVFAGMPRWLRHGLHVIGNTSDVDGREVQGTSRTGVMQIEQIDGVEIRGNRQHVSSGTVAVGLVDVCNLTMVDNAFPGASADKQQSGKCSPKGSPTTAGGSGGRTGTTADGSAAATAKRNKGSTNRDWMIAGLLAGAAVVVILGQQALRKRARARA